VNISKTAADTAKATINDQGNDIIIGFLLTPRSMSFDHLL